jgi:hypothetical protein
MKISFFIVFAACFIAGCNGVYVPRPVGEMPHALVAADWEGTWLADRDVAKVKVLDAARGQLQLLRIDEGKGAPRIATTTVFITEVGADLFASLRNDEETTSAKAYLWGRIRRDNDQILLWWPDVKRFGSLVGTGKLSGTVADGDVLLDPPTAAQLTALVSGDRGPVFDAASPGVLRRIAR